MRVTSGRATFLLALAVLLTGGSAVARLAAHHPAARGAVAAQNQTTIKHLLPRPDSSGPQPKRLEWTAVPGADSYSVGIWNEVDVRIWRVNNVTTNSVDWPQGLDVDPGTYFWSILAVKDERPIGDSGLAAFIVVR